MEKMTFPYVTDVPSRDTYRDAAEAQFYFTLNHMDDVTSLAN